MIERDDPITLAETLNNLNIPLSRFSTQETSTVDSDKNEDLLARTLFKSIDTNDSNAFSNNEKRKTPKYRVKPNSNLQV